MSESGSHHALKPGWPNFAFDGDGAIFAVVREDVDGQTPVIREILWKHYDSQDYSG